jgi:hypothetical protein
MKCFQWPIRAVAAFCFLMAAVGVVSSAEPYFITLDKLELKKDSGEWLDIIEPNHPVDLMNMEATISFFNNGRVPAGAFKNFRITFEDHGQKKKIFRKEDLNTLFEVKQGSFVNISFQLDLGSKKVKETRLAVDQQAFVDFGDSMETLTID